MSIAFILIILFLVLVLLGLPIAISFAACSLLFLLGSSQAGNVILASRTFGSIDSFPLMAIPFFILAGDLMKEGGLSRALVSFADKLVGKIRGGLGHVTILASMFFGAISGSSAATVAAIGGIMIPEMTERGYDKRYATALASTAGFLGILIPPSIPLIVYGLNAQVSVAELFLASIGPGILMGLVFMTINYVMVKKYRTAPELAEVAATVEAELIQQPVPRKQPSVIPALLMPVVILGGIYSGIFTPTEAGAVAVVYGLLVSVFYYKSMKLKQILDIATGSALTSSVILIIIAFAGVFGWIMTTEKLPTLLTEYVTSITQNKYVVLLILNVIFLILGTFMETVTAIVITTPMFLPLVTALGVDPIHFGIVQQTNLCVGLITPPMALNLLVGTKIAGMSVDKVVKPLLPYLIAAIVVVFIVTYIPEISMYLPNVLMK